MTERSDSDGAARRIPVFFYGLFMRPDVLLAHGVAFHDLKLAELPEYDIAIDPLSRIYPKQGQTVFGVVVDASHAELARLYATNGMDVYLPEPVLVRVEGQPIAALTYRPDGPAHASKRADGYVEGLVAIAGEHGFPSWYIDRIVDQAAAAA